MRTTDEDSVLSEARIQRAESIISELTPILNDLHGVTYSKRFWKIVIRRYVNSALTMRSSLQASEVRVEAPLFPINAFRLPSWQDKLYFYTRYFAQGIFGRRSSSAFFDVLERCDSITIAFPGGSSAKELGTPLPMYSPMILWGGSKEKRRKLVEFSRRQTSIFDRNVVALIPKMYVEYFSQLYDSIQVFSPDQKVFHVYGVVPPFIEIMIAKYVELGAKLIWYQHGAYYGEFIGHNAHYFESTISDEYRTWGWKWRSNDVPWIAYRLEVFRRRYLALTPSDQFDALLCLPAFAPRNEKFLLEATRKVVADLSIGRFKRLALRPRPGRGNSRKIQVTKRPGLVVRSGDDMVEIVRASRLVVQLSVPSTSFLECISVDHPTVGVLHNEQPTHPIKEFYEFFLEVGVLHRDIESLIRHLNAVDVVEWWRSVTARSEYCCFKVLFLNTSHSNLFRGDK